MFGFTDIHPSKNNESVLLRFLGLSSLMRLTVKCILLFSVLVPSTWAATTTYENGTSSFEDRWRITRSRSSGSSITSTYDSSLKSSVLSFSASSPSRGNTYLLGGFNSRSGWNNQIQKQLVFKLNTSDSFIINVRLLTTFGPRYIRYKNSNSSPKARNSVVDIGLGTNMANGSWQTIDRNLQQDLESAESGNSIIAVNGLLIRGILKLDDVKLTSTSTSTDTPTDNTIQSSAIKYSSTHTGKAGESTTSSALVDANVLAKNYSEFVISANAKYGEARIDRNTGIWTYFSTVQSWSGEDNFTIVISGSKVDSFNHIVTISQTGIPLLSSQELPVSPSTTAAVISSGSVSDSELIRQLVNNNDASFVDESGGSDDNNGSLSSPWKTLGFALGQLTPGDTLIIRGGIYNERNLSIELNGSRNRVTTIRNYPGESVTLDGSNSRFTSSGDTVWELYDEATSTFRTKKSDYGDKYYTGYAISSSGVEVPLIPYYSASSSGAQGLSDLRSKVYDVSSKPRYVGPGLLTQSGRVYLRLSSVPYGSLNGSSSILKGVTNPNKYTLSLSSEAQVLILSGKYINVSGLTITGSRSGLTVDGGSSNIEITDSIFRVPSTAIILRDGVKDVMVNHITVNGNFPDWLAWTDMKGNDGQSTPASYWPMRSAGINGSFVSNISVLNSHFNRVFDGMVISGNNINVSGNYGEFIDDFIQLGSDSSNVYIHENTIRGSGPSHYGRGDSESPGTIFVHDNYIDSSVKYLIGKNDPSNILEDKHQGWRSGKPIAAHALSAVNKGDPWKIYQNTIVFDGRFASGSGLSLWDGRNETGKAHEVYNNLIIEVGGGSILKSLQISDGKQYYDGNIYWQNTSSPKMPIFSGFANKKGDKEHFYSVESLRSSTIYDQSKRQYKPGWENSGNSGNPHLDSNYRPIQGGVAASGAVKLPNSFHGESNTYRGALAP
jgi:hypothetical protein